VTAQSLYSLAINTNVIKGLTAPPSLQRRQTRRRSASSGALHHTAGFIIRTAPRIDVSSRALGQILALLNGSLEAPMLALDGTNGAVAIAPQLAAAQPGWMAGTTGTQWQLARGEVYATRIAWSHGDPDAVVDLSIFGVSSDGSADPVAESHATAAPAHGQDDEAWTLTACTLNGVALTPESLTISIDARAENTAQDCYTAGLIHPVVVTKAGVAGPIMITAEIETLLVQATLGTGPLVCTFTQRAQGGLLTGTTKVLTLNGGMIGDEGLGGQPLARRISYEARHDGTNRPLTIV
jgi:hypothetical protein